MRDFLLEQIGYIADALPEGMTFDAWLAEGNLSDFNDHDADTRESVAYAAGNLNGAAFAFNRTMRELLDAWDIDPASITHTS